MTTKTKENGKLIGSIVACGVVIFSALLLLVAIGLTLGL